MNRIPENEVAEAVSPARNTAAGRSIGRPDSHLVDRQSLGPAAVPSPPPELIPWLKNLTPEGCRAAFEQDGTFHYSLHKQRPGSLSLRATADTATSAELPALEGASEPSLNIELFRAPGNLTENFAQDAKRIAFAKSVIEDLKAGRREKRAEK